MKADILRKSILQYAIQGKLVPQIPSEESAHILLEKIKKERQELIKQGKLKKEKPLAGITEDELPFDIPESWTWVRLGELSSINGGYAFKSNLYKDKGIRVIKISDFNEKGFTNKSLTYHDYFEKLNEYKIEINNVIMAMTGGTVGKSLFITELSEDMYTNQRVATIKINKLLNEKYINFNINSEVIQLKITESKNSTNDNISMDDIKSFLIPLPPLEEQKRIVAKIEELMALVDKYELYETELEKLEVEFPERLKKSILQYAIQGKLVPQISSEESAHILLEKIKKEKQELIKQGKLKKEKPLAEITEDDVPFDIPESWEWAYLINFCLNIADVDHKMPKEVSKGYPYISPLNFTGENTIRFEAAKMISEKDYINLSQKSNPQRNDIIFPRYGTIGVIRLIATDVKFIVSYSCATIHTDKTNTNPKYIYYLLRSNHIKKEIEKYINKTTQPNVGLQSIKKFLVPIPPLEEQIRIVAKIEEIFAFINLLSGDKKVAVNKITIPSSSTEETKIIEFPKPKFDVSDFELAARQTADVPSDTMEEVIKQVKEHYDNKN